MAYHPREESLACSSSVWSLWSWWPGLSCSLVSGTISFSLGCSVAEEPSSPQRGKVFAPLASAKASYYITWSISWVGCPFAGSSDHLDATQFLLFVPLNSPT